MEMVALTVRDRMTSRSFMLRLHSMESYTAMGLKRTISSAVGRHG